MPGLVAAPGLQGKAATFSSKSECGEGPDNALDILAYWFLPWLLHYVTGENSICLAPEHDRFSVELL